MEFTIRTDRAEGGYNKFADTISKGERYERLQSGIGSHCNVRVRTSAPALLDFRWKQIETNLWVNVGSAKNRLGIARSDLSKREIQRRINLIRFGTESALRPSAANINHRAIGIAESFNQRKLFVVDGVQYIPIWKGERLKAVYELTTRLGQGGYGEVWSATDLATGKKKAVKRFDDKKEGASEYEAYRKIGREREVDLHEESGSLLMEQMDGDLRHAISRGVFDSAQRREILKEMWRQLGEIHGHKVAHRDIKLSNILYKIMPDGKIQIRIADPGLAVWREKPPKRSACTRSVTRRADLDRIRATRRPEDKVAHAAGADIFSAVIESIHLIIGKTRYPGNKQYHDGRSPCSKREFLRCWGADEKSGERAWCTLSDVRRASLSVRNQPGEAMRIYETLARATS